MSVGTSANGIEWVIEQVIRSEDIAVVVADGTGLSMAASRRLHLAVVARASPRVVIVVRPSWERAALSAALTRWWVQPAMQDPLRLGASGVADDSRRRGSGVAVDRGAAQALDGGDFAWDGGAGCSVRLLSCKASVRERRIDGMWGSDLAWGRGLPESRSARAPPGLEPATA